ncbi:hypothetical protein ERW49_16040 [Aliivibrio finisterrensis]|jgi:hypothetical protein|uniref:KfrA N-terminal DNA-binding domain-containing protein n=1 Tax=Aliivibrio finisterrensis TaxID=511998 RepID=A0A4Q5KGL3_9GAMM|nr:MULTISPECIES: hypothetical protein [Aliivibrio]MCP3700768.1 hypothetical protein [Aliivibrio sp.]MDD9176916.1 hypothetical protein [Aliivibrio sp. S3TY1]MDD9194003.1 hypothetical protein [Aliivibrio sp. S2TY2]RYU44513.1 hypothetical protein ERW49_16040 [Aliivibrio finisterrensis]
MKNVTDELQKILQDLTDEGKKPTTALVRSRLTTQVPMPAIIAAVKSFKSTSSIPKIEVKDTPLTADERIAQLELQVKELSQRLAALENK